VKASNRKLVEEAAEFRHTEAKKVREGQRQASKADGTQLWRLLLFLQPLPRVLLLTCA
jgi:hypothetical protein